MRRGAHRKMVVDPWAVAVRHGRWYLLCWSLDADARRVLRIDRITTATTVDRTASPPVDLDAVRDVEDHLADGWTHQVEVHFSAHADQLVGCVPRTLGRVQPLDDHSCVLRGSTDDPAWYAAQLASIPAPITMVDSAVVRTQLRAVIGRLRGAVEAS
ncbi:MAG: helix-turn-helix transcriptional regulator [Dermatophilaceae bacterium]